MRPSPAQVIAGKQLLYTSRMWRALRIAVIWLVALAIPLQGLAAATMVSCGPGHHEMAAKVVQGAEGHDHAARGHVSTHETSAAIESISAQAGDDTTVIKNLHELAQFKCSACAACCSATALPSSVITFGLPRLEAALDVLPLASSATFQTGGPERPPRNYLV